MASFAAGTGQFHTYRKPNHRSNLTPPLTAVSITSSTTRSAKISSQNPNKPLQFSGKYLTLSAAAGAVGAAGVLMHLVYKNRTLIGLGGGNGGGGGGGGGGGWWNRLLCPEANAEDDKSPEWDSHGLPGDMVVQLNKLSGFKKFKVSELVFLDKVKSIIVGSDDSFFEMVSIKAGGVYTKAQLQKELETLAGCGMFEKVDLEAKTKADGTIGLTVSFTESTWEAADRFKCINVGLMLQSKPVDFDENMSERERIDYMRNQEREYKSRMNNARPCMLPRAVHGEVLDILSQGNVSARMLQNIRDRVQKWYHDQGYACAQVVNFGNLNTNEVVCEVVEGDMTKVVIQFLDKMGNVCEGNTHIGVVKRELPKQLQRGNVFNIEAGKLALRNINSLSLFSNIEVNPRPDEKNEGGIVVEIKLKELDQKQAEVSYEWNLVPGSNGYPTLATISPGGTVSFEHRNIKGLNRSFLGSVNTSNFFNPQNFTPQSKFTYGVVMEEIKARDESNDIASNGQWILSNGGVSADGPPTTLSGTGIDRMAFAQANITQDNTKFVNGEIVGARNVFQLDQGLFIGSKFPFFNRHQLTSTRFIQLKAVEEGAGKPQPPVLVLHGHYGGCVGDLPNYDAFTLGGPTLLGVTTWERLALLEIF